MRFNPVHVLDADVVEITEQVDGVIDFNVQQRVDDEEELDIAAAGVILQPHA